MEAATIVRELILQVSRGELPGVPSAHVIRIVPAGYLAVEGPVAAGGRTVSRAAQLLDTLLPGFDASAEHRASGGLRLAIARGLGMLDLPRYPSLESFADALERFASPDPARILQDLAARAASSPPPVTLTPVMPLASAPGNPPPPAAHGIERTEPAPGEVRDQGRSHEEPESTAALALREPDTLTVSDIRRARRATGLPLSEVSSRSRIPAPLLLQLEWGYLRNWPVGIAGQRQLVRYARAAGLDEHVVLDTLLPLVEQAAQESGRASASFDDQPLIIAAPPADVGDVPIARTRNADAAAPSLMRKRTRKAAILAIAATLVLALVPLLYEGQQRQLAPPDEVVHQIDPAPPPPAPAEPSPAQREPYRGQVAADGGAPAELARPAPAEPAAAQVRRSSESDPAVDPQPAQGLTEAGVAYSPNFASAGSAMFYHAQDDSRSALMRADTDDDGAILRVTKVIDDHARNFHARPSPDGTQIAFDSDRDGERGVYVANADGTNVRRVSGDGFAAVPSWSPDGRTLAFVRAEPKQPKVWNLWTLRLDSGEMRRLTSHRYGQPWGGSWFPDGRRLAYSHEDRLIVLNLESGSERIYPSPRKGRLVRTPAVSPDGQLVIFQVYRDGAWLLDLRDGSTRKVLADPSAEEYTWSPDGRRVAYHSRQSGGWGVWLMAAR